MTPSRGEDSVHSNRRNALEKRLSGECHFRPNRMSASFDSLVSRIHSRGSSAGWWEALRGHRVWVAWSGGADSTFLLHLLLALQEEEGFILGILHFDHALRPESAQEAESLAAWAKEHQIPIRIGYWKEQGQPVWSETEARLARYAFYQSVLISSAQSGEGEGDFVALGHHSRDQLETFFLNLIRGTGLKGLSGMEALRPPWFRPLLDEEPETLREALRSLAETWIEDPSNLDRSILRNAIRHQLVPTLRQVGGESTLPHTLQTMETLRVWKHWIARQAESLLESLQNQEGLDPKRDPASLPRPQLAQIEAPMLQEVLATQAARLYPQATSNWTRVHYQKMESLVRDPSGAVKELQFPGGWSLWKAGRWLTWAPTGTPPQSALYLE